jgi:hypothetical protein
MNRSKTGFDTTARPRAQSPLHPSWIAFIRHCQELGCGEISQLKIQDGLPIVAEEISKKIKFS